MRKLRSVVGSNEVKLKQLLNKKKKNDNLALHLRQKIPLKMHKYINTIICKYVKKTIIRSCKSLSMKWCISSVRFCQKKSPPFQSEWHLDATANIKTEQTTKSAYKLRNDRVGQNCTLTYECVTLLYSSSHIVRLGHYNSW